MAKRKQRKAATEQEVENHDEVTVAAEAGAENDGHTAHAAEEGAAAEEGVEREGGGEGEAEGEEGPDAAARGGEEGKEEEREVSFDELGLDEQLKRALRKKGLDKATPIQREAIPLILEGKDVVAKAKTGSGKTFAYLLPMLHELLKLSAEGRIRKSAPNVFILVPTRELCQQVHNEASSLLEFCTSKLKVVQVNASMSDKDIKVALSGPPNILVTTPACVASCISKGIIRGSSIKESLSMMILDEISCDAKDKMLYILALLKLELIQKKVLIFVNSIDSAFKLRLFLEKAFNARLFDYLIATDDNKSKEERQANKGNKKDSRVSRKQLQQTLDAEFGVVRGIDFKNVFTVVNYDMPPDPAGYVHRVGRTGRAHKTGASISLVSPKENGIFEDIENMLKDVENRDTSCISPFPLLTKNAVESLRYRAQDVARSVTTRDIKEARRQDIKNEILNSEKLKAHFDENPRDLDLLKHDKLLSNKEIPAHLRDVPEYLIDPTTKEASNVVKLSRAAMDIDKPRRRKRMGFKGGSGRSSDPLKTFSAEGKSRRRGRKERDGEQDRRKRKSDIPTVQEITEPPP
uniref:RNA helicase n=1 Tax=Oryza meridionalis TaxID=40149 RepID=A0A0E0D627_9ORYZ